MTPLRAGSVDEATRLDMFVNDLGVVKAEGSGVEIASLEDVKNIEGKVAIGDAVTVPAGKYANQALNTIGLYTGAAGDDGVYAPEFADRVALADQGGHRRQVRFHRRCDHRLCLQL